MFRQATRQKNETTDEYHMRLRQLLKHCEFADVEFEIKMQIVCNGTSSRLRKKALKERDYSLKDMLIDSRKSETSNAQASGMEEKIKDAQLNKLEKTLTKSKCYNCGFAYPHLDRPCPAENSTCNSSGITGHFARVCRKKGKQRFPKPQEQSQPTEQSNTKLSKHDMKRSKRRNHARTAKERRDSSTESSSEEDYAYSVKNKGNPKTKTTICINSRKINFINDTGATVDVIDSKTYDRLQSSVKLFKRTTKIFAYGSDKPLPLKGQFQAALESDKRFTNSVIHDVEGSSGNLLRAKTAQDLGLIQLVNKVTEIDTEETEVDRRETETTESTNTRNIKQTLSKTASSLPKCTDQNIQRIIDKYETVFVGEGKLSTQQVKFHIFDWNNTHQRAFEQVKKKLTQAPTMAYFDTAKRSLLIVDGSPLGICAILAQRDKSTELYRIISYASRALSPVESRYSQTDIEALSLVWGIEHFRLFLLGTEFDVYTDHKALEAIFNNPKSKPPARIERWMMRLQPYNFRVTYKKGTFNEVDYLSRHPVTNQPRTTVEERIADNHGNFIINHTVPKSMTLQEIKDATKGDVTLMKLQECLKTGKWEEKDTELKLYRLCAEELSMNQTGDLVLKGSRIVKPKSLQDRATKLGHGGHQGIEKTKSLLREKIWYAGMDDKVKKMIENCAACQAVGPSNSPEPMRISPTATEPWQSLAINFYGPVPCSGQYLLVVIDTYSKFPEVEIIKSTSAKACIPNICHSWHTSENTN